MRKLLIPVLLLAVSACHRGPSAADYFNLGNKGLSHKIPYHDALDAYNKAIELKPDYTDAYAGRGQLEIKMHNFYGAQRDLQKALLLDHNIKGLYYFIGYSKQQVGDQEGAQLAYTKAIAQNSKDAKAFFGRATAREIKQDQGGALQDFNSAISIEPDNLPDVYRERGLLKIKINDKNGGCADLYQSYKLKPDSITLHYINMNCK